MLRVIEERFRSGETLSESDKAELRLIILTNRNLFELQSAIYIYGSSFPLDSAIVSKAEQFIHHPAAGLTAVCLKVLADLWGLHAEYADYLQAYLDYNAYDEWSDETIVSLSFYLRNPQLQNASVISKLATLKAAAKQDGANELLDLFNAYRAGDCQRL
jgi:hypothetical protein